MSLSRRSCFAAVWVALVATTTTTASKEQAPDVTQARLWCAETFWLPNRKDFALCVDDFLLSSNAESTLSSWSSWPRLSEYYDLLSPEDKKTQTARIACASVQNDHTGVFGTDFDECVEEVVHSGHVAHAALWMDRTVVHVSRHNADQDNPQGLRGITA